MRLWKWMYILNLFTCYLYFQSPTSTLWKDPALSKVNRFCRESRCMDQWVPIINLPERWTWKKTTCERTSICARSVVWTLMDTLPSRDQIPKHCWWGKNNLEKEKRLQCLHGRHLKDNKREKRWGMDFHFGQFGVASVSLDNEDEMARHELENEKRKKKKKTCACFSLWSWTLCRRIISCTRDKTSMTSQKSVEKPKNGAVEWTKASASLCRNRALVETLDLMQFHLFDSNC